MEEDERVANRRTSVGKILLAAFLVLVLSFVGVTSVVVMREANRIQGKPAPNSPLIGTWKGSRQGTVMQYRSDGTGRYRGAQNKIHYFEWTLDGNQLSVFHEVSSQAAAWKSHLHQFLNNGDGLEYRLEVLLLPDNSVKVMSEDGVESIYTRTTDPAIDAAR